jgi:hypothetical protein
MSSPYTVCEYIGRKGYCGKRCFGGRCNIHRKRETLALCLEDCGRGTASITGYCHQCGYKQMTVWKQMKKDSFAMGGIIDEWLSWDWIAPECQPTPATPRTVVYATSG